MVAIGGGEVMKRALAMLSKIEIIWGLVHKTIANLRLRHGLRQVYVC